MGNTHEMIQRHGTRNKFMKIRNKPHSAFHTLLGTQGYILITYDILTTLFRHSLFMKPKVYNIHIRKTHNIYYKSASWFMITFNTPAIKQVRYIHFFFSPINLTQNLTNDQHTKWNICKDSTSFAVNILPLLTS